jgi:methylase of polypeptide subunit release factors
MRNGENFLFKEEVTLAREVLGEDFQRGFSMHKVMLGGKPFLFCDLMSSNAVNMIAREIGVGTYDFSNIDFREGDVVVDIGGNVGMISIFLAKKFPFLKIYAFEPVRENFENFKRNIKINEIPDGIIIVENLAVTKNGRDISMAVNTLVSGSSSMHPKMNKLF